jgi:hypothetical protein
MWRRIYLEGRCLRCGMRITVDCKDRGHTRDGQWCGPIETDHPFAVPDEPTGQGWMVPWSHGLTPFEDPAPVGRDPAIPPARILIDRLRDELPRPGTGQSRRRAA